MTPNAPDARSPRLPPARRANGSPPAHLVEDFAGEKSDRRGHAGRDAELRERSEEAVVARRAPSRGSPRSIGTRRCAVAGRRARPVTGCHDCHTPKKDSAGHIDENLILSGRPATTNAPSATPGEVHSALDLTAWTGPWGTTYASNLTPDPMTGLVSRKYNEATFLAMFRYRAKNQTALGFCLRCLGKVTPT